MIHAAIYRDKEKKYTGFRMEGHADFDESGSDIVCAAASMLVINTMNAIEIYTEDMFSVFSDEEEGVIELRLERAPSGDAVLLLDTMILGMESMARDENYKDYIEVTFEEV